MKFRVLTISVVVLALAGGFWAGSRHRAKPPDTGAIVLVEPRDPGAFALIDHRGAAFGPTDIAGQWTLWFFGFTHCPDVCPMTLSALDLTDRVLAEAGATRPAVVMVSVDPARDTPQRLAAYVPFFNPAFVGLTGPAAEIHALTQRLGVIVQFHAQEGDSYTIDHGTALMLTGPDGLVYAVLPSPHEPARLAADLAALIPWLETR